MYKYKFIVIDKWSPAISLICPYAVHRCGKCETNWNQSTISVPFKLYIISIFFFNYFVLIMFTEIMRMSHSTIAKRPPEDDWLQHSTGKIISGWTGFSNKFIISCHYLSYFALFHGHQCPPVGITPFVTAFLLASSPYSHHLVVCLVLPSTPSQWYSG